MSPLSRGIFPGVINNHECLTVNKCSHIIAFIQIEPGAQLPSPEMLKGRILLKDKIRLKKTKEG